MARTRRLKAPAASASWPSSSATCPSRTPRAPESLRIEGKPAIDLGVELAAQGRPDGLFEVDLKLSIKASTDATASSMSNWSMAACSS